MPFMLGRAVNKDIRKMIVFLPTTGEEMLILYIKKTGCIEFSFS
jgi:hypothetical protein